MRPLACFLHPWLCLASLQPLLYYPPCLYCCIPRTCPVVIIRGLDPLSGIGESSRSCGKECPKDSSREKAEPKKSFTNSRIVITILEACSEALPLCVTTITGFRNTFSCKSRTPRTASKLRRLSSSVEEGRVPYPVARCQSKMFMRRKRMRSPWVTCLAMRILKLMDSGGSSRE